LKKYLYVLRPLLAARWIEQGRGMAPMQFQQLVEVIVTDVALRRAIDELLALKRTVQESEYGAPLPVINSFISSELALLQAVPPSQEVDFSALDRLFMETVLRFDTMIEENDPE
jgi:predicted nucleotidyltransferase